MSRGVIFLICFTLRFLLIDACPSGTWGQNCTDDCPLECASGPCDAVTGNCPGCPAGFTGTGCKEPCPDGYYGINCSETCSQKCLDRSCNPTDGACSNCAEGYGGDQFCSVCPVGTYGKNCTKTCPPNCLDCGPIFGKCTKCAVGWAGSFCKVEVLHSDGDDDSFNLLFLLFIPLILFILIALLFMCFKDDNTEVRAAEAQEETTGSDPESDEMDTDSDDEDDDSDEFDGSGVDTVFDIAYSLAATPQFFCGFYSGEYAIRCDRGIIRKMEMLSPAWCEED